MERKKESTMETETMPVSECGNLQKRTADNKKKQRRVLDVCVFRMGGEVFECVGGRL